MIKHKHYITCILAPFICGYFITCLFRTINSVQAHYIIQTLHISTNSIGWLTSIYFLAFALAQLPIGIALDKHGPRTVQATLFVIAGIGTLIFAFGENTLTLAFARFIIGIGVSGGLMAALKANSYWFKDKIALMNGLVMAIGGLGAYAATQPSEIIINMIGWRTFNIYLSGLIFIIALLIFMLVPREYDKLESASTLMKQTKELLSIYKSSFFWGLTPVTIITLGLFTALQGLWAGPWFQTVNNMSISMASFYLSIISIAFVVGIFLSGLVGNMLIKKGIDLKTSIFTFGILCLIFSLIILNNNSDTPYITWFGYALFAQFCTLSYAAVSMHYDKKLAGRAVTALNLLVFLSIFFIQYLYGFFFHLATKNFNLAPEVAHHYILGFFVALQAAALLWLFLRRKVMVKT